MQHEVMMITLTIRFCLMLFLPILGVDRGGYEVRRAAGRMWQVLGFSAGRGFSLLGRQRRDRIRTRMDTPPDARWQIRTRMDTPLRTS